MQRMTWDEMQKMYPDEWVAIAEEKQTADLPYGSAEGVVVAHATNDDEFTAQIKKLPHSIRDIDIRFTGEVLPDNPIGPVLWRISDSLY